MRVTDRIIQTDYMTAAVVLAPHTDEAIDVMKGVDGGITCVLGGSIAHLLPVAGNSR